jgi:hypothetical protein
LFFSVIPVRDEVANPESAVQQVQAAKWIPGSRSRAPRNDG